MAMLHIHLFGRMRVRFQHAPSEITLPPSARTLLAYLLLQPHRLHPREVLFDICWGDRPENRARDCLNTALWRLRRALEPDDTCDGTYLVTTQAGEVGFNWDSRHWLDLEAFETCTRRFLALPADGLELEQAQDAETILPLYEGDLLEGFYEDWALHERERLRMAYLNCLVRLMRYHRRRGAFEQSIDFAYSILRLDPLREDIHREIMRLYCQTGRRALAVQQYKVCTEVLSSELGIAPMPETQALLAQILSGAEVTRPGHDKPSSPQTSPAQHLVMSEEAWHLLGSAMQRLDAAREELTGAMRLIGGVTTSEPDGRLGRQQGERHTDR